MAEASPKILYARARCRGLFGFPSRVSTAVSTRVSAAGSPSPLIFLDCVGVSGWARRVVHA
jgi:hypothetical protein